MKRTLLIVALATGAVLVLSCVTASADSDYEKYQKHMKKYYERLGEAQEEADEGDWKDYHKEMNKAQEEFWKAQEYRRRISAWDPWYEDRPPRHFEYAPRYEGWGYPRYYAPPPPPRRSPRFFIDLDLDF